LHYFDAGISFRSDKAVKYVLGVVARGKENMRDLCQFSLLS